MSRIGKQPIDIPQGVSVKVVDRRIMAEGPKGKLSQPVPGGLVVPACYAAYHAFRQTFRK